MSSLIAATRPLTRRSSPGRIVERTTTVTREIFLDDPAVSTADRMPALAEARVLPHPSAESSLEPLSDSPSADTHIRGFDRALVRLGVWLIERGRRHTLRPTRGTASGTAASADEIARRVDAAKAHDMKHFIGLPC